MTVSNENHADMHHIVFENINVELQDDVQPQILQTADAQQYDAQGKTMSASLIANSNTPYAIRQKNADAVIRRQSSQLGDIHDITYRNIRIFTEGKALRPMIRIDAKDKNRPFRNFRFESIYINGKKASDFSDFDTFFINAENITLK